MKETLNKIDKNTWIISDLHLGHKNILNFEPVRAEALKNSKHQYHEDMMVHNWNSVVKPVDTVLCLGDVMFNGIKPYSEALNGNKILILGNHDRGPYHTGYASWTVMDGIYVRDAEMSYKLLGYEHDDHLSAVVLDIDGKRYMFSHYPVYDENQFDRRNPKILPRMKALEEVYEILNCDFNVHGHTHSKSSTFKDSINVSVECLPGLKPIKIKNIL